MKRILGQGYIEDLGNQKGDSLVVALGQEEVYLHYKVKVPIYLAAMFRDYGTVKMHQELFNEFYTPAFFYTWNGIKCTDKECNEMNTKFKNYYRFLANFHDKLAKQNISLEQLAYLLPFGIFGVFIWKVTVKDLIDFLYNNLTSSIPERKEIAQALLSHFKNDFPATSLKFLEEFHRRNEP